MGLSKSLYVTGSQCMKALWLKIHKPEEEEITDALQSRFDTGQEIGELARQLFAPFTLIEARKPDGRPNIDEMIHKTALAMDDQSVKTICEAAIAYDGNYCAVDILRRHGDEWDIYEVKSSSVDITSVKDVDKAKETYRPDYSYQRWVLEQRNFKVNSVNLVLLNTNYVLDGELDIKKLFSIIDVTDDCLEADTVRAKVNEADYVMNQDEELIRDLTLHCKKPHDCLFMKYCLKQKGIEYPSVFNLYRAQWKKKLEYFNNGIVTFDDIMNNDVKLTSKTQKMQIDCTMNNKEYIDKASIRGFLSGLKYPLYYLDFETMQPAVPIYQGTKPYQQIPFQYSLHIQYEPCGPLEHKEFLGDPNEDPRRALAEQLCRDIPRDACAVAYNKSFECGRIEEMANYFVDLRWHLLDIREHIVDLLEPFQSCYYYVPAMRDSFSIKSVLPALFPNSEELNYHNLNENVQNGAMAMTVYPAMRHMNEAEVAETRAALLAYCCLDTLAMVRVCEKLYEVSGPEKV